MRPHSLRSVGLTALALTFVLVSAATVARAAEAIGDTLTVIQRPLLNLPAFALPGGSVAISCQAVPGTTGWAAELIHGTTHVPLNITASIYETSTTWWRLEASVPAGILSELYDLRVTAAGGIDDVTRHAVKVLPTYRSSYYFVQITDCHVPTHLYYTDLGADADSASTVDLREVIRDINVVNPEFVLVTGDLVNEGELEDYLLFREYTRAQRLLGEFHVPVFLTSGNHDVGGWDSTLPSDGTARRDWWRFFGWKRLSAPPAGAPARTQDYSFDYGPIHYIGMEAYLNYDGWLPAIYGTKSFTAAQLSWLNTDLAAASGSTSQVLFTHSDFSNQLSLTSLGLEMTLSGHTHSNSGSLTTKPYKLITAATVDGARSYRVVRVANGVVTPLATVSAGSDGQNLDVAYTPSNDGTQNAITASISNGLPIRFENALLRFVMPAGPAAYVVTGGTLQQTEDTGVATICYVTVDLPANATASVSIEAEISATPTGSCCAPAGICTATTQPDCTETWTVSGECEPNPCSASSLNDAELTTILGVHATPNPFTGSVALRIAGPRATAARILIFNAAGRLVRTPWKGTLTGRAFTVSWDGRDDSGSEVPAGVYLVRAESASESAVRRLVLIR
jgi:hypothetical protein